MAAKKNPANTEILKTENIHIRCTPAQKELVESMAARKGLGASSWMLMLALEASQSSK